MAVFFTRRSTAPPKTAIVTITGVGDLTCCYATINGTPYTRRATGIEVLLSDVITFSIFGVSSTYYGALTIDGTQVLKATDGGATYEWTVPNDITDISIVLECSIVQSKRHGIITVTTS